MKVVILLTTAIAALVMISHAQNYFPSYGPVRIGTPMAEPSSLLDVKSFTKGVLIPRMNAQSRRSIYKPALGLLVFQTDGNSGLWYFKDGWKPVASPAGANTKLSNLVSQTAVNVSLAPDKDNMRDLGIQYFGWKNLYMQGDILMGNMRFLTADHGSNVFLGFGAGEANATGSANVALGNHTLTQNISGNMNTAVGWQALHNNVSGEGNTAVGLNALTMNDGMWNTAVGFGSLLTSTTGSFNVAMGPYPMSNNTSGSSNIALGYIALGNNTEGFDNIAIGSGALGRNQTGCFNTSVGHSSLLDVTSNFNTALGYLSGYFNSAPVECTFLGSVADANDNVTNSVSIGYSARALESNQVMVGSPSIHSIGGYANWTNFSDGRYKQNIKEDVPGLEFINMLRPVTYTLDINGVNEKITSARAKSNKGFPSVKGVNNEKASPKMFVPQLSANEKKALSKKAEITYTGFIAQEVEDAAKQLNYQFSGVDVPEGENGFYGLRYGDFVVPLVKAMQELSRKNEELKEELRELRETVNRLEGKSESFDKAALSQNYPNPFSGSTVVRFSLPANSGNAKIIVTNAKGQQLQSISVGKNMQQATINSGSLPSGSYHYSLWIDGKKVETRQMVIAR